MALQLTKKNPKKPKNNQKQKNTQNGSFWKRKFFKLGKNKEKIAWHKEEPKN